MKYHGQFFTALVCSLFLLLGLANQASARLETLSWDDAGDESIVGFRIYKRTQSGNFALDREVQIEGSSLGLNSNGWFLPSYQVDDLEIQVVAISAFNEAGESTLSNSRRFNDDDADGYPNASDSAPNDPSIPSSGSDPGTEPPPDDGGGTSPPPPGGGTSAASYRLNAGGDDYVDAAGNPWKADAPYANTGIATEKSVNISRTPDDSLYQTQRWSTSRQTGFSYALPIQNGDYRLRLHFVEMHTAYNYSGARLTDVRAEGTVVLSNYDIFRSAGALNTAVVEEVLVQVNDGTLNLDILQNKSGTVISGIEVIGSEIAPEDPDPSLDPPGQPTIIFP